MEENQFVYGEILQGENMMRQYGTFDWVTARERIEVTTHSDKDRVYIDGLNLQRYIGELNLQRCDYCRRKNNQNDELCKSCGAPL